MLSADELEALGVKCLSLCPILAYMANSTRVVRILQGLAAVVFLGGVAVAWLAPFRGEALTGCYIVNAGGCNTQNFVIRGVVVIAAAIVAVILLMSASAVRNRWRRDARYQGPTG
jgi:uncharacterized membrane protein